MKSLRDAIANRYNRRYGTKFTADHVIAGSGGKQELTIQQNTQPQLIQVDAEKNEQTGTEIASNVPIEGAVKGE